MGTRVGGAPLTLSNTPVSAAEAPNISNHRGENVVLLMKGKENKQRFEGPQDDRECGAEGVLF